MGEPGTGEGMAVGTGGTGSGDGRGRGRAARAVAAAAVSGALLGAGVWAFFEVPAFHRLLHPHGPPDREGAGGAGEKERAEVYTCPMHPFIESDRPGVCPICNMALVPKESEARGGAPSGEEAAAVERVSLSPTQRLLARVATVSAGRRTFAAAVEAAGRVAWDERRVARVAARVGGRVERLHVDFTGTRVAEGEPLLDIYSPELVATQREYLIALAGAERVAESPDAGARRMAAALRDAARTRLALWGFGDAGIAELERTRQPRVVVTVSAPASGIVTERLVAAGQYVAEGTPLYAIAAPSPVWVLAEIYETEIAQVPAGAAAVITTEAYPGREFRGRVAFVDPALNPETRTLRVRVDLPNPGGLLKPEMFVRAAFRSKAREALAVPEGAVLVTGERAVVWVEVAENAFEPRTVRVGRRSEGYFEILGGLAGDETVVASAGFLVDSESRLRGGGGGLHEGHAPGAEGRGPAGGKAPEGAADRGADGMPPGSGNAGQGAGDGHAGHGSR